MFDIWTILGTLVILYIYHLITKKPGQKFW